MEFDSGSQVPLSIDLENRIRGAMKYCQIGPDAAHKLLTALLVSCPQRMIFFPIKLIFDGSWESLM